MANNTWRHPNNTQVKQVKTFAITAASTTLAATWTFTLTLDNGDTVTVTYTEDGSPTIAEIVTGLKDAWNNSTNPHVAAIAATEANGTDIVLTADTAGVPFSVSLADDSDGTHTETDTTANVGNTDYGTARNWQRDAVPVATDDALFPQGSVNVKYGLNQSGVAIADFFVFPGCKSEFGRIENGLGHYLRIDPDSFKYEGAGALVLFDIGAAAISPLILSQGSPSASGRHAVYIKGSAIGDLEVLKGNVGVAAFDGDTATITQILCGFLTSPQSDVNLTVGSGVTLTTLEQYGGVCTLRCATTTVNVRKDAALTTEGTGTIGTLNAYGVVYPKSTGTITTLNAYGTVDLSRDRSARTLSTVNGKPGGKIILHSGITVTTFNLPDEPGSFTIEFV